MATQLAAQGVGSNVTRDDTAFDTLAAAVKYRSVARLLESMLHDARNPLNALSINLDVLTEKIKATSGGLIPAAQEKNLKAMREQVLRVDATMRLFADFLAPRQISETVCNFSQLVTRAIDVLGHEFRKGQLKLKSDIAPDVHVQASDSPALIFIVLQPVLRAIERCGAGASVEVTLARAGDRAVLTVTDTADHTPERTPEVAVALEQAVRRRGGAVEVADTRCRVSLPVETR